MEPPARRNDTVADPLGVLKEGIKQVPAVRYASGVLGIAAAASLIRGYFSSTSTGIYATLAVLALMVLLWIFAQLARLSDKWLRYPAMLVAWSLFSVVACVPVLLVLSAFFDKPKPFADLRNVFEAKAATHSAEPTTIASPGKSNELARDQGNSGGLEKPLGAPIPKAAKVRVALLDSQSRKDTQLLIKNMLMSDNTIYVEPLGGGSFKWVKFAAELKDLDPAPDILLIHLHTLRPPGIKSSYLADRRAEADLLEGLVGYQPANGRKVPIVLYSRSISHVRKAADSDLLLRATDQAKKAVPNADFSGLLNRITLVPWANGTENDANVQVDVGLLREQIRKLTAQRP